MDLKQTHKSKGPERGMILRMTPVLMEGYEAYHKGFLLEDNPYLEHSFEHEEWADGWMMAQDDGEEVFYQT